MKKKILILFTFLSLLLLSTTYFISASAKLKVPANSELLGLIKESNIIRNQLIFDVNKAYSLKINNEKPTDLFLHINFSVDTIETIRKKLLLNINNPTTDETDRKNSLLLIIGIDYYKIAYEELKDYLLSNDITTNFNSLDRISYDLLTGEDTLNRLERQLSL